VIFREAVVIENREQKLLDYLQALGIAYQRYEHPAVLTVDEANQYWQEIEGIHAKNLFLRNAKGDKHYLVVMEETKLANLKVLAERLGSSKLSFASAERLEKHLGLAPGAVSPFGLINDAGKQVIVVLDKALASSPYIPFHPNVNTATLRIDYCDFERFLEHCGNKVIRLDF